MGFAKLYFEKGIPDVPTIKKWTVDFGCFHAPETLIKKANDNKTLFVEFDGAYPRMCVSWLNFYNLSGAKWISLSAKDELGEGEGFYLLNVSEESIHIIESQNKELLNKSLLQRYKTLKSIGFSKEYLRFSLYTNEEGSEIVLDFRIPESYYKEILKDVEKDELE